MSKQFQNARITVPEIRARKGSEEDCLFDGIYHANGRTARRTLRHSTGRRLRWYGATRSSYGVTLDMMLLHGKAVMRGSRRALVIVDLPFSSYERGPDHAFRTASKVMKKTGCQAIKVEASEGVAESISFLVSRGIPVMGHVGLRPQANNVDGGFKAKGRTASERERVLAEARAVDAAGAFAILVEGVASDLADEITTSVKAPTIGIGASQGCDGQILVTDDMLGLFDWTPKFVRRYADLRSAIDISVSTYAADVRARR